MTDRRNHRPHPHPTAPSRSFRSSDPNPRACQSRNPHPGSSLVRLVGALCSSFCFRFYF
ncbi:hypothetical protein B0H34DRAFT_691421 [Crassisporium funariophilum]|nr:hypothetical protein B0H34DRAFT_691421 [Crassisporium funariophilum]